MGCAARSLANNLPILFSNEKGATMVKPAMVIVTLVLLSGCGQQLAQPSYYQTTPASAPAKEPADFAVAQSGRLPVDYKKKIDQYLIGYLKDPDSRKVTFGPTPYGGLACGEVNAKNSYGGYTGAQPFYAIFNERGNISTFISFPPDQVNMFRNGKSSVI
jgi:hypothetical protein